MINDKQYNRKEFISFLGKAGLGMMVLPSLAYACKSPNQEKIKNVIPHLPAGSKDDIILSEGLSYQVIIKWGDEISDDDYFGYNNDFTCFIPFDKNEPNDGLLWVNHEYINPLFVSDFNFRDFENPMDHRTIEQVDKEMYNVGGTIVRIRKENGVWKVVHNDKFNRRITAKTPIKLNWDHPIKGKKVVIGTHSNCSGGITPWNTFLTCEENYDQFYGETIYGEKGESKHEDSYYGWEKFYDYPSEHYGWVVEVDPLTGEAQKHIALGRFAHECCTLVELEDKRIVAYSGDDKNDEFLYKFISSKPGSLKEGTLYVADTMNGKWLSLDRANNHLLQEKFRDQTEVLIRVREAAKLLGATPLHRPEDIEIDPITGNVIVSLTNNKAKGDYHGSLLKVEESNGRHDALTFQAFTYKAGGEENGFSCPDNLAFDHSGNLWMTTDMSGSAMNRSDKPYTTFGNNSLFVIPRTGEQAGEVIRVATGPIDSELTGPWFSPDGKTLFLSVQHPGGETKDIHHPTSLWPFDEDRIPKSAVVAITGELIDQLNGVL